MQKDKSLVLGHRKRIRQRLMDFGADVLADYEKLELFLTLCIPRKDVKDIAKNLLLKFASIRGVLNASDNDLMLVDGIGESVICNIKILRMCINAQLFEDMSDTALDLDSVELIAQYFESRLAHLSYEVLEILCLDSQLRLLGKSAIRITEGSIDTINVDLRKIIEIAFKENASSIVLAHNHPRGEAKPSKADLRFTRTLSETCRALKLDFIEHIIIAKDKYFSFRRQGHLDLLFDSTQSTHTKVASKKKALK